MRHRVILDRDGVINEDFGYICQPERLQLIPGSAQAIASLHRAGFIVSVVSNQSAVGRGWARMEDVEATNSALCHILLEEDPLAVVDEFRVCPHSPQDDCLCRKPKLGLVQELLEQNLLQPEQCWIVGDKLSDLNFGINLGVPFRRCLLVLTGFGKEELEKARSAGDALQVLPRCCRDLAEAAELILKKSEWR